jgi:outer membrane protein assembly factor BamB
VVAGGSVYIAGDSGGLFAYDAAGKEGCNDDLPPACDTPLWRAVPGTTQFASPTVVNGIVFVGGNDGAVYAFDAKGTTNCATQSGETQCSALRTYQAFGPVSTSPAVVNGTLYVTAGAAGRTLYAFDAGGGAGCSGAPVSCAPLWSADLGGVASDPTVAAGRVYVGAADGRLYAFDGAGTTGCTGSPAVCSPLWTATLGGTGKSVSTPAYANGVLYATSTNGRLYAVSATGTSCSGTPTTCTPLWRSMVGTRSGAPAVASGIVYSATSGGIQAFDATGQSACGGTPLTCTPQWTATGTTAATPAIANGVLYVGQLAGPVQAFDAAGTINCSGAPKSCLPLWTGDDATGSPVVANGALFIRNGAQAGEDVYETVLVYALAPPQ